MLTIPANGTIAGSAPSGASEVTCTLFLLEVNATTGAEAYTSDQQQLPLAAATIYTATADGPSLVRSIHVANTDAANTSTFQLFVGGTGAGNAITPVLTLPAGGSATYEDGEGWTFLSALGLVQSTASFSRTFVQRFTIAGADTYVPSVGMKACIAIVTGGGGGGGGADTAGGSADVGVGSGGGAGGTAIGWFTAAQVGVSKALSIGTFGTAGSATNGTDGGAGGNSTWGLNVLVGTGGAKGIGSGASSADSSATAGGLGGVPTGGTINITGGAGGPGYAGSIDGTTDLVFAHSGMGGASFWGGGPRSGSGAQASLTADLSAAGNISSRPYGTGGAGAFDLTNATGQAGGSGMTGIIVVIEFIG